MNNLMATIITGLTTKERTELIEHTRNKLMKHNEETAEHINGLLNSFPEVYRDKLRVLMMYEKHAHFLTDILKIMRHRVSKKEMKKLFDDVFNHFFQSNDHVIGKLTDDKQNFMDDIRRHAANRMGIRYEK